MLRSRLPAAVLVLALAAPGAALAQSTGTPQPSFGGGNFGPLPSARPAQPPVQTAPVKPRNVAASGTISAQTTILLFAVMIIGIGAIVLYIRRDARAAAPVTDRQRSEQDIHGNKSSAARHKQERKRQARAKAKRQRAARKKQR